MALSIHARVLGLSRLGAWSLPPEVQGADHTPELPLQNDGTPVLFLLTPNATQLLDISTCNPGTTTPTVLAIIDAATLEPIRQAGGTTDKVWVAKGLWWWRCLEGVGGVVWCVWVWVTGGRCGGRGGDSTL